LTTVRSRTSFVQSSHACIFNSPSASIFYIYIIIIGVGACGDNIVGYKEVCDTATDECCDPLICRTAPQCQGTKGALLYLRSIGELYDTSSQPPTGYVAYPSNPCQWGSDIVVCEAGQVTEMHVNISLAVLRWRDYILTGYAHIQQVELSQSPAYACRLPDSQHRPSILHICL
jgi:hypothetical protein